MNQPKKLIVVAGGTGGHVFPGITVAHYLINKGWQVRWIGTSNRMEAYLVPKYGIKISFIHISSFRDESIKRLLLLPFFIFNAWRQAYVIMKKFKPNVVLGMGGYVSGPVGLAAWSLGIPVVLHEQNSIAGLTNRWLSVIASKVIQAFFGAFPNAKVVGNPIRTNVLALSQPEIRLKNRNGPIRILVVGGSQGAQFINQIMPQTAKKLGNAVIILHQTGRGMKQIVEQLYYTNIGPSKHQITEFIDDIAIAYDWADLVICRSGALTVSEIAVVGLAAIFIPFPHKDRQQYWNALPLVKAGAAKIFEQKQLTIDSLVSTLLSLNRKKLLEMAKRSRFMAILNATERVAREIGSMVKDF